MSCKCEVPRPSPNPRTTGCNVCGKGFHPDWLSSSQTHGDFLDRLAEATFPGPVPDTFRAFRHQCEAREIAGRDQFGLAYLVRKNCKEAREEGADMANYFFFDHLQEVRRSGSDEDYALALEGAKKAYEAYLCALRLSAKRKGAP